MRASANMLAAAVAVIAALSASAAAGAAVSADSVRAKFTRANELYEKGDYEQAIVAYRDVVEDGVRNPSLYYDLGNAYYKVGSIGRAVLYYERARRMSPRDPDIAENLSLARSLLRDRQFVDEMGWLRRTLRWPQDNLNTHETFLLASFWYAILTLALLGFIFRESRFVSGVYSKLSMVSPGRLFGLSMAQDFVLAICTTLLLFGLTAASAQSKYRAETVRPGGVVVSEEVAVYGGPSNDSTLQFKIHEGTQVKIDAARHGWMQVRLPGGLSGWIRSGAVERI